jgi:nicotinate-nucleotide--dimethylbenzimidazole phosphoribosyltransferase
MDKPPSGRPFDDIRALVVTLPGPDEAAIAAVRQRDATLTKPPGALGRLEELTEWLAAWQGRHPPRIERPLVAVFAGNHGVVAQGVAAYPQDVTAQMVANFRAGGAAINQICKVANATLKVFELALAIPTRDITADAAMAEDECAATIAYGMEAVAEPCDLLCIGEMGIGNTTIAAAIGHALYGGAPADWAGPGTGLDQAGMARKADAVGRAIALHNAHLGDPLEVLRRVGGREIAAMVGAIVAARARQVPVFIDGYVATAAAAIVHALAPGAIDHCMAAHRSAEPAHAAMLRRLGKTPLLDLGMRLGEGTGAGLAIMLARAACELHAGMATFAEAGVSDRGG